LSSSTEGARPPRKNDTASRDKADEAPKTAGPFDVRTVKALVALMTQHDLSEIELRDGNQRLRLRRGANQVEVASHVPAPLAVPTTVESPAPKKGVPAAPPAVTRQLIEIKSPTPGTFYASAKPGEPPFAKVGTKVTPATVVCLIEAMKLYNEVQAECAGVIVEALVENQQPVEYGQVLFKVDPAG
jgi:acetyl-CoA carboxylase biotin carboxyl carrier protein